MAQIWALLLRPFCFETIPEPFIQTLCSVHWVGIHPLLKYPTLSKASFFPDVLSHPNCGEKHLWLNLFTLKYKSLTHELSSGHTCNFKLEFEIIMSRILETLSWVFVDGDLPPLLNLHRKRLYTWKHR